MQIIKPDRAWANSWYCTQIIVVIIGVYAYFCGQKQYLAQPFDPENQECGRDINVKDYPYIYFASPVPGYLWRTVCVKTCPMANQKNLDCAKNIIVSTCHENLSPHPTQQVLIYDTTPYAGTICLPLYSEYFANVQEGISISWTSKNLHTLVASAKILISVLFACVGITALLMLVMISYQFFLLWCVVAMNVVSLICMVVLCSFKARFSFEVQNVLSVTSAEQLQPNEAIQLAYIIDENGPLMIVFAIIFFTVLVLFVVVLRLYSHKIHHISLLVYVAVQFLSWNPYLLGLSVGLVLFTFFNFTLWGFIVRNLLTIGWISHMPNQLPFQVFSLSTSSVVLAVFVTLVIAWNQIIICGMVDYFTEALVQQWYYKWNKFDENDNVMIVEEERLISTIKEQLYQQIGVIIKGSLLLLLVVPIKFPLHMIFTKKEQIRKSFPKIEHMLNQVNKFYLQYIEYIHSQTYLQCSIDQQSFAESGIKLYEKLNSYDENKHVNRLTYGFGNFFSKVFGYSVGFTAMGIYYLLVNYSAEVYTHILNPTLALVTCFLLGTSIGYLFISTLGEAINGLTIMMIIDNDEQQGKRRYGVNAPEVQIVFILILQILINFYRILWEDVHFI